MTDAIFIPKWETSAGNIATVTEDDVINITLNASESYTTAVTTSQYFIILGNPVTRVSSLKINNVTTAFTTNLSDKTVIFSPLVADGTAVITTTPAFTFTLLNGILPPGITLSSNGHLAGTIGNIVDGPYIFEFTIRMANEWKVRDRTFTITASGIDHASTLNPSTMPADVYNSTLGLHYRPLGSYHRTDAVSYTLDFLNVDGVPPVLSLHHVVNLPNDNTIFGSPPPNVTLINNKISGIIAADTPSGSYYFQIRWVELNTPNSINFMISVAQDEDFSLSIIPNLQWVTLGGSLGTIVEGSASYFSVLATATVGPKPTYSLSSSSKPLPTGITLDSVTGNIIGTFASVTKDTTYDFTVRAISNHIILERTFSITVKLVYASTNIYNSVELVFRSNEKGHLTRGYDAYIDPVNIFRASDINYGIVKNPNIYLIGGLNNSSDLQSIIDAGDNYYGSVSLILGDHHYAVAKDTTGTALYEVIYRKIFDPLEGAGGYDLTLDYPSETKVIYSPSNVNNITYVYPKSIQNIRYNLVDDLKFASSDTTLQTRLGINGIESMPLWMKSTQKDGTILGFTLGVVIAYVNVGSSPFIIEKINNNLSNFVPQGYVYEFEKYYFNSSVESDYVQLGYP